MKAREAEGLLRAARLYPVLRAANEPLRLRLERSGNAIAGGSVAAGRGRAEVDGLLVIKRERMPDGRVKLILKDEESGAISQRVVEGEAGEG